MECIHGYVPPIHTEIQLSLQVRCLVNMPTLPKAYILRRSNLPHIRNVETIPEGSIPSSRRRPLRTENGRQVVGNRVLD